MKLTNTLQYNALIGKDQKIVIYRAPVWYAVDFLNKCILPEIKTPFKCAQREQIPKRHRYRYIVTDTPRCVRLLILLTIRHFHYALLIKYATLSMNGCSAQQIKCNEQ